MPIRVSCTACGHSLAVPDAYAGKSGKCPKCGEKIRIPAPANDATKPSASTKSSSAANPTAKSSPTKTASLGGEKSSKLQSPSGKAAAPAPSGLDQLFSEAGLDKQAGPMCPGCQAPVRPGTVICTACGYNLQTGEKIRGLAVAKVQDDKSHFANKALSEADKSLTVEAIKDEESKFSGMPWWVYLAFVLGLIAVITFGVIYREGATKTEDGEQIMAPEGTIMRAIQELDVLTALMIIAGIVAGILVNMSTLAILIAAFKEKALQGVLVLFVPFYLYYYAISRYRYLKKAAPIFWGSTLAFFVVAGLIAAWNLYKVMSAPPG